jgi:hypothetical protein
MPRYATLWDARQRAGCWIGGPLPSAIRNGYSETRDCPSAGATRMRRWSSNSRVRPARPERLTAQGASEGRPDSSRCPAARRCRVDPRATRPPTPEARCRYAWCPWDGGHHRDPSPTGPSPKGPLRQDAVGESHGAVDVGQPPRQRGHKIEDVVDFPTRPRLSPRQRTEPHLVPSPDRGMRQHRSPSRMGRPFDRTWPPPFIVTRCHGIACGDTQAADVVGCIASQPQASRRRQSQCGHDHS